MKTGENHLGLDILQLLKKQELPLKKIASLLSVDKDEVLKQLNDLLEKRLVRNYQVGGTTFYVGITTKKSFPLIYYINVGFGVFLILGVILYYITKV